MSGYSPNQQDLSQMCLLLQALRDPSRSDHVQATNALTTYIQNPVFVYNIMFVFGYGGDLNSSYGLTPDLRQLSGFVIKNYLFQCLHLMDAMVQKAVKDGLLVAVKDPIPEIRNTACILLGRFVESFPTEMWADDILPGLLQSLDPSYLQSTGVNHQLDGAIFAVKIICEDSSEKLSMDLTRRPLDTLIPRLVYLLSCSDAKIRQRAIETYNSMLFLVAPSQPGQIETSPSIISSKPSGKAAEAVMIHMQSFLQGISQLASDPSPVIRRCVCQSIVLIASMFLSVLEPIYDNICNYMLQALLDADESVSCEACEFWYTMANNVQDKIAPYDSIVKYFNVLIPNLVSRMILTEEKIAQDRLDEEAEQSGEKSLNIRPLFGSSSHQMSRQEQHDRAEEEDELSEQQTIRKQAAVVLDTLGVIFPTEDLLKLALPIIQSRLSSTNVWERESGLLALGALSHGCEDALSYYTPHILPFLISSLQEQTPELRSIACWVLSRYCGWFFEEQQAESGLGRNWYVKSLECLLKLLPDPKPKVQSSAISALIVIFEKVPDETYVLPFIQDMFNLFHELFPKYGVKSKIMLIDIIGCIATLVGEEGMANSSLTPLYFPYIYQLLNSVDDTDMRLYPIMECLVCVLPVMGMESQPYILTIYKRYLQLLDRAMSTTEGDTNKPTPQDEPPPKELAICALDGISSISTAYGQNFAVLIESPAIGGINSLLTPIFSCLHDPLPPLRQSAFSVLGELFKHGPISLIFDAASNQPKGIAPVSGIFSIFMELLIQNLKNDYPMVFNNSVWAIGELTLRMVSILVIPCPHAGYLIHQNGASAHPSGLTSVDGYFSEYLPRICYELCQAMQNYELDEVLQQNIAITWGILCRYATTSMAQYIEEVFKDWCMHLKTVSNGLERENAFYGLVCMIHAKPQILFTPNHVNHSHPPHTPSKNISSFIDACVSWSEPPTDQILMILLRHLLICLAKGEYSFTTSPEQQAQTSISLMNISPAWKYATQVLSDEQRHNLMDNFKLNL